MNHLNTDRVRHNLRAVAHNVEQALENLSETAGDEVDTLRTRAGRRMRDARDQLDNIEYQTARQLRRAGRRTQEYVQDHPWQVVGGLTLAAAAALAVFARTRH